MRDALYRVVQDAWSAWLARSRAADFAAVERFLLFVGYPRSGHSLIGAALNAHRDAVVAHELDAPPLILAGCSRDELYARLLARAQWFHLRGDRSNYSYRVPGAWQGRFSRLRVIGDKRGGSVTRCLARQPDFLERVRALTGVPLRLIHVVRNPFDNIAAIALWERRTLADAAGYYFELCATTARLPELCRAGELVTVRHEQFLADPSASLVRLCSFLGLEPEPAWLEQCRAIVFAHPTHTRTRVEWAPALVREVERRAAAFPHLAGYGFTLDEGGEKRTKLG
ncbi:MAG: sulfotransferase [Thermodesulfobacteriota bacterium]